MQTWTATTRFELFPFQRAAVAAIHRHWHTCSNVLLVAPTGSGKTVIAASVARDRREWKTLFLAHRNELINQAYAQMRTWVGDDVQLWRSGEPIDPRASVVVASVQGMARRYSRFSPDLFGTVIVDECHHSEAITYLNTLEHFSIGAEILGITATPDRGDRKLIGRTFQRLAYEISLPYLISIGRLSKITLVSSPIQIDVRKVRMRSRDFDMEDLAEVVEPHFEVIAFNIRANWETYKRKKGLVFLPTIASAKDFAFALSHIGFKADYIYGEDPKRKEKLADFHDGAIDILVNASLLTEGFDEPEIDMIVILRPTKVRPLFVQMIGRGTRVAPGKQDLMVLDFFWLHERHKLIHPINLFTHNDEEAALATEIAQKESVIDLEKLSTMAEAKRMANMRARLEAKKNKEARVVDLVAYALEVDPEILEYEPISEWDAAEVTEDQKTRLRARGINPTAVTCQGHAAHLIEQLESRHAGGLASPKQIRFLRKLGIKGDIWHWSKSEAGFHIEQGMKRKGWKRR